MARKRSIEQVIEEYLAIASQMELASFVRAANLVSRAKYPDAAPTKAQAKRGRPLGAKSKPNGAEKFPERTPGAAALMGEPA